ncbi:MAG: ribonuclease III [Clostridiales bacterium]|nr:ribonuclease III [Clostridiales bacterium]
MIEEMMQFYNSGTTKRNGDFESIKKKRVTTLAYVGDAIYEVFVRVRLASGGELSTDRLSRAGVRYVRASAQARAMRALLEGLPEEDKTLVLRARNHRPRSVPKNADPVEYRWATAFEALIGALYLSGRETEMEELIAKAIRVIDEE